MNAFDWPQPIARFVGTAHRVATTVGESPRLAFRFKRGNDLFPLKMCSKLCTLTTFSARRKADGLFWLKELDYLLANVLLGQGYKLLNSYSGAGYPQLSGQFRFTLSEIVQQREATIDYHCPGLLFLPWYNS